MTFVAGSSWQPDEDLFIEYFNQHPEVKLIIAPHVIDENHLVEIIRKLKRPYVRYTRANEKNVRKADCLIIDCFGLLSSIYRYGEIAISEVVSEWESTIPLRLQFMAFR